MGFSGREEWREMEFLSYSVSDQLDFSTEELENIHQYHQLELQQKGILYYQNCHCTQHQLIFLSISQDSWIIRDENSAAFLVTQGKDEALSQIAV